MGHQQSQWSARRQQSVQLCSVDRIADPEQARRDQSGHAATAQRADERELTAAGEHQRTQGLDLPAIQPSSHGERAERDPVQPGGDRNRQPHPDGGAAQQLFHSATDSLTYWSVLLWADSRLRIRRYKT
ncbi:hypothetical protein SDC9_128983 [bioreactor metagenome]|uniref:Uncharacterized protein n=1 Tax=bioreactor metagenome TaxID=1076179 RepID=A0A645CYH1_9ZZZZ